MRATALVVSCALVGLASMCNCHALDPPKRPTGVPLEASWAGGSKGGCWIHCELDVAKQANKCVIYDDYLGEIWHSGFFVLETTREPVRGETLRYDFFNGETIGLTDGRRMVQLEPTN